MNLHDWARSLAERRIGNLTPYTALEAYLRGQWTFAEAAVEVIDELSAALSPYLTTSRKYRGDHADILERYRRGDDPEPLLREVLGLDPPLNGEEDDDDA